MNTFDLGDIGDASHDGSQREAHLNADEAARLARAAIGCHPAERLIQLRRTVQGRLVFATSFGLEDQAILHLLHANAIAAEVVTLDTGRLFAETYALWSATEAKYDIRIKAFYPETAALEALVARQGIDGFYRSPDARLACCGARKVAPLERALAGAKGWITGLRADQSQYRGETSAATFDAARGLIKASPLFDWSRQQVLDFAVAHDVPVNPLHRQGFASIGCAPCTRAIRPGEPERAGRWWWEQQGIGECGLHLNGKRRTQPTERVP